MNARIALSLALVGTFAGRLAQADAPAGRYTVADGRVYDTKTKLTWQQSAPSTTYSWADAKAYCSGLSLAGTGWRLPTLKELHTIFDERAPVDPTVFPSTDPFSSVWSSSPVAGSSSRAWYVFGYGSADTSEVSEARNVRCVR